MEINLKLNHEFNVVKTKEGEPLDFFHIPFNLNIFELIHTKLSELFALSQQPERCRFTSDTYQLLSTIHGILHSTHFTFALKYLS